MPWPQTSKWRVSKGAVAGRREEEWGVARKRPATHSKEGQAREGATGRYPTPTKFRVNEGMWRPRRTPEGTTGQGRVVELRATAGPEVGSARATDTGVRSGVRVVWSRKKH
ncbi:unnamed protein product [Closterium sp. NIES-64]|nr:unnamed protein product [Closterium sp. NIES-64]